MPQARKVMNQSPDTRVLKSLIWVYLVLLVAEGALRKWIFPGLSDPLLIIRDPVVLLIYWQAYRSGKFPNNPWMIALAGLSIGCALASVFAEYFNPAVMIFGLRANFLHLPLIFVIGEVLSANDVKRVGTALLLLALPMSLLMVLQFRAGPTDWLNTGAGGGGQISSALGKIRPAGTFSFISGPTLFFAAVTAFVLHAQTARLSLFPLLLSIMGAGSIIMASAVSGSRSLLSSVAIVGGAWIAGLVLYPRLATRAVWVTLLGAALFLVVSGTEVFLEGHKVTAARIEIASMGEGGLRGFVMRFVNEFTEPLQTLFNVPLMGHGLGLGTNGGAALSGARDAGFLLAEREWGRVLMEVGPLLGLAFLGLRSLLTLQIAVLAVYSARRGRLLPLLLYGAGAVPLINGQWGQPTTQGFASLLGGLCLAAMKPDAKTALNSVGIKAGREIQATGSVQDLMAVTTCCAHPSGPDAITPGRFAVRS